MLGLGSRRGRREEGRLYNSHERKKEGRGVRKSCKERRNGVDMEEKEGGKEKKERKKGKEKWKGKGTKNEGMNVWKGSTEAKESMSVWKGIGRERRIRR